MVQNPRSSSSATTNQALCSFLTIIVKTLQGIPCGGIFIKTKWGSKADVAETYGTAVWQLDERLGTEASSEVSGTPTL